MTPENEMMPVTQTEPREGAGIKDPFASSFLVITPTFNSAKTIERTIRSVAAQNIYVRHRIRYVIQDGGSNDLTIRIAESLTGLCEDRGIELVIRQEKDEGIYDAIARGYRACQDHSLHWFTWIGSDDFFFQHAFDRVANTQRCIRWAELILSNPTFRNELKGNEIQVNQVRFPSIVIKKGLCDGLSWWHIMQEGSFIASTRIDKLIEPLSSYKYAGDFFLWLALLNEEVEALQLTEPTACFTISPGQTSQRKADEYQQEVSLIKKKFNCLTATIGELSNEDLISYEAHPSMSQQACTLTKNTIRVNPQTTDLPINKVGLDRYYITKSANMLDLLNGEYLPDSEQGKSLFSQSLKSVNTGYLLSHLSEKRATLSQTKSSASHNIANLDHRAYEWVDIATPLTLREVNALARWIQLCPTPTHEPERLRWFISFDISPPESVCNYIRSTAAESALKGVSIVFISADLSNEENIYIRANKHSESCNLPYGLKSGPNRQFFATVRGCSRHNGTGSILLVETDCFPLREYWLDKVRKLLISERTALVAGPRFFGKELLDLPYQNHLNGNSCYAIGAPLFNECLDAWEAILVILQRLNNTIAYDIATDFYINSQEILPREIVEATAPYKHLAEMLFSRRRYLDESIIHIDGGSFQPYPKISDPESFSSDFPGALLVHSKQAASHVPAIQLLLAGKTRSLVLERSRIRPHVKEGMLKLLMTLPNKAESFREFEALRSVALGLTSINKFTKVGA